MVSMNSWPIRKVYSTQDQLYIELVEDLTFLGSDVVLPLLCLVTWLVKTSNFTMILFDFNRLTLTIVTVHKNTALLCIFEKSRCDILVCFRSVLSITQKIDNQISVWCLGGGCPNPNCSTFGKV